MSSSQPGKSRLDLLYRIPEEFFVFVKNEAPDAKQGFVARGEISIEVLDSTRTSVARELLQKQLYSAEPVVKGSHSQYLEGLFSSDLKPGHYTVSLEISDLESSRKFRGEPVAIRLKDLSAHEIEISDAVLLQVAGPGESKALCRPWRYGGDVPLGQNFDVYCEIASEMKSESLLARCELSLVSPEPDSLTVILRDTLSGPGGVRDYPLLLAPRSDTSSSSSYIKVDSSRAPIHALWLHFRGDTLPQGSYVLTIHVRAGAGERTLKKRFHVRWFDMPASLRSLPFAVEALEYIATKDELKEMRSADARRQRKLFDAFWKNRDRTPGTAFNEVMAEYYTRVDHAFTSFGTHREPNGVKTDRGKAYILYGPPSSVRRQMIPGSPTQEIWAYTRLKKTIVFVDKNRSGDYELDSIQNTQ